MQEENAEDENDHGGEENNLQPINEKEIAKYFEENHPLPANEDKSDQEHTKRIIFNHQKKMRMFTIL